MPRPTILVVDDEQEIRAILAEILSLHAFDVIVSAGAREALALCKLRHVDIVLSDVMMPGMDGLALLAELRRDPKTHDIPVILLTADPSDLTLYAGLEHGAEDFITKPFKARELVLRLRAQLESRKRLASALRHRPEQRAEPSRDDRFIAQLRRSVDYIIDRSPNVDLSPASIADNLLMSLPTLRRHVRRVLGMTLGDWLLTYRLERARQMLGQRIGTVSEISFATGFKSPSHFSQVFRRRYGVTPSEYTLPQD